MVRTILALMLGAACVGAEGAQAPASPADAAALRELQDACRPEARPDAALAHVQVRAVAAGPGDLPYYEAHSRLSGSSVRIYHDPELADAAASKIACFMGLLDMLPAAIPDTRRNVAWSPMVITRNANYIPPKRDGELRWANVFASNTWDASTIAFLLDTMPHEEVHFAQGGFKLPRWFAEGHAEWASLQVTEQVRPDLAGRGRARYADAFARLGKARLGSWGGVRVKPEAIERQLSAEDRERRARDPSWQAPGPFSFQPGDFVEDDGDEEGRYGAALALFDGLERRHGRPAVHAWVRAVLDGRDAARIVPLARQMLGEDLAPLLR